jgi:hypothetical protein
MGLAFVGIAFVVAGFVISRTQPSLRPEVIRARFAMVTFVGILVLFVFAAVLYAGDTSGRDVGKDIFEKAVAGMTPLAGVIIGYLFGQRNQVADPSDATRSDQGS